MHSCVIDPELRADHNHFRPYSTLVSTLQTKNIVTSYEAPNKNKNTTLLSVKTIKTYDNKVNGGEKTFAR